MPKVSAPYRAKAFRAEGHVVFFAEASGPYPGIGRKNRPPRFAHVVVEAGPEWVHPFSFPTAGRAVRLATKPPRRREAAVFLGQRSWAGRVGVLALAPPFPAGGIDGDHLVFQWEEAGVQYAISLHAWLPLEEAEATLKALVESTG